MPKYKKSNFSTFPDDTDWCNQAQIQSSQISDKKHRVDENNNTNEAPTSNEYYDYSEASEDEQPGDAQPSAASASLGDTPSMLNDEADSSQSSISSSAISSSTLLSPITTPQLTNATQSSAPKMGSYSPVSENSDDDILLKDSHQVTIGTGAISSTTGGVASF